MMKRAIKSVLFLLVFNAISDRVQSEVSRVADVFGRKSYGLIGESNSKETSDDKMIRRIEEEMLLLNKSGDMSRDKRALGILLQGFMEALGYTVSPIQLASLPNPMPMGAAAAPPSGGAQSMPPMPAMLPAKPAMANASASTPQRQRETLRFTGLLNFGNSENTTNLIDHLARYEQLFHGNRSASPAAAPMPAAMPPPPPPPDGPDIDPRNARPPLKEPLFVKIPLPIVPNLPPPQPPSAMPLDHRYQDEYFSKDSSEEYSGSEDEQGQRGTFEEEDDDSHRSEEFEYKHDHSHNPEDRNYYDNEDADGSYEQPQPKDKHVEKEYKANKNVENLTLENKQIHHPSEVSEEGPANGSQFNHATFVDEPNWKEEQDAKIYKIAAEQEARAEALAEENAERDKQQQFHRTRQKEIDQANEQRDATYERDEEQEDSSEKQNHDDDRQYHEDDADEEDEGDEEEEEEAEHEKKGTQRSEARAQAPASPSERKNDQETEFYPGRLPISYDREKTQQGQRLRDSYGASLEKPGGQVDERVAEYISMFKNPQTGLYDPEHARISFDHGDLIDGFNRIQKEYGSPENKYEEYEIDDADRVEHRSNDQVPSDRPKADCNCKQPNKIDVQVARSSDKPITHPPPAKTSTRPKVTYGPYYSTLNYTYAPLEHEHDPREIIARLTSYDTPTTVRFEDRHRDLMHKYSRTTAASPTIPPERLTTMSFLHEAEAKEIRAWPAPFDYLYDNSEHKNVVYKKSPPIASSPAPFKPTRASCNYHMMPFGEHKDKLKMVFREHASDRHKSDRDPRKPSGFHEDRKAKPSERLDTRLGLHSSFPATQATMSEHRKKPASSERSLNYRTSSKPPTHSPSLSDIISPRPERPHSTKSPRQNRKNLKPNDHNLRPAEATHRQSTIKPTIKVKYTYPYSRGNLKEETTNYVEKNGMLIIPEPTPYYYHEEFEEFTEEPQSNTERVKIKEYRNRIASVKVSQLKQLHPEGSMQIFKYTRNL